MKMKKIVLVIFLIGSLALGPLFYVNANDDASEVSPIATPDASTLTILTRHDITITDAFADAFIKSDIGKALGITAMDFRQGTTDQAWKDMLDSSELGVDLAWGGGPALFNTMNNWNLLKPITNDTLVDYINSQVNDTIAGAGMKLKDGEDLLWIANAISSFGFTVNHDFLDQYGLPVPHTWEELASPAYYINPSVKAISMGNPPDTTSNTRIYQIILQAFGWEEGWSIMTRMAGNAGIYPGSVDTRAAAVNGEVGIAMTIDFYGVIAKRENPNTEYIVPEGQSIVNGDPIALGKYCDNQAGAEGFLEWVFSPEGQAVWLTEGLDRLPVNPDAFLVPPVDGKDKTALYTLYNDTLVNEGIDFDEEEATDLLQVTMYYFESTISNVHSLLRQTWGEMVTQLDAGTINETYFDELKADLGKVNMTYEEAFSINTAITQSATQAANYESKWRNFASTKYNAIYRALVPDESPLPTLPVIISLLFVGAIPILLKRKKK